MYLNQHYFVFFFCIWCRYTFSAVETSFPAQIAVKISAVRTAIISASLSLFSPPRIVSIGYNCLPTLTAAAKRALKYWKTEKQNPAQPRKVNQKKKSYRERGPESRPHVTWRSSSITWPTHSYAAHTPRQLPNNVATSTCTWTKNADSGGSSSKKKNRNEIKTETE